MNFTIISENLARDLTEELGLSDERKDIISYAIETIILSIIGTALLIGIASFFNALIPAVVAAIFGGLLRKLSGGAHFNTPIKCLVFGALTYSAIGVLAKKMHSFGVFNQSSLLILILISFLLLLLFAPVDSQAKPIHSRKFKMMLKVSSITFVSITFLIISISKNSLINVSAVLGLIYQSLTLLPILNRRG